MKWYEIGFPPEAMKRGDHLKLTEMMRSIWERNGKPDDFALLGTHKVENIYGKFTVFYLTPSAQQYCSSQVLTIWSAVPTDRKPSPETLKVFMGDEGALRLLD